VGKTLDRMGVLGSTVLWFEQDSAGRPLPPAAYRAATMASVTTHDLPTAAGYLEAEHVHARARLGLLGRSEEAETAQWRADRAALVELLRGEGLLPADVAGELGAPGTLDPALRREIVFALHRLLVRSPSRIVVAAPGDALGDRFQPNLPGTVDAYPNWRLPVTDAEGRPVTVERLRGDPDVRRLGALLAEVRNVPSATMTPLDANRPPASR
jgi:4-alpha-glucanotransferase